MNEGKSNRTIDEQVLLQMMTLAFIDIRAPDKPSMPYIISDIYHNVPGALAHGVEATELLEQVRKRADRHNVLAYVESMEAHCRQKYD